MISTFCPSTFFTRSETVPEFWLMRSFSMSVKNSGSARRIRAEPPN